MNDAAATKQESRVAIPPLIRRNTIYLASAQAFVGAGFSLVPTLGAIIVVRLLGSASLAGLATSILGISRLLVSYPIGRLTDVYGRKVGVILGLLVGIVGAMLLSISVLSSSFPLFMLGLLGIGLPLLLGVGVRIAASIGIVMYTMMYAAAITPANNPFLDAHIIGIIIMAGLVLTAAGSPIGLGRLWVRIPLVKRYPLLK